MKKIALMGCIFFTLSAIAATPDFLILGVTKCGTTSLYDYIIKHPKILGAHTKELHFFDAHYKYERGVEWYSQQFPEKKSMHELIGEATPGYFWKPQCAERILQHCPQAKLIVMFRNPVKRLISEYFRLRRQGFETLGFEESILKKRLQTRYMSAGIYIEHLERWLSLFPKNQILVLILEDLAKNPEKEVNKVFKFLGLEEYKLDSYEIVNKGKYDTSEIRPETIENLKRFYQPYNKKLEAFLGRTLPW